MKQGQHAVRLCKNLLTFLPPPPNGYMPFALSIRLMPVPKIFSLPHYLHFLQFW